MVRTRPTLPSGHGEVVERPTYDEWPKLLESNRALTDSWDFVVAGLPVQRLRAAARGDLLSVGSSFSARLGVEVRSPGTADHPLVATGHQPDLYHPGVWVKDFLLERLARQTGASSVDIVVDTDGFDAVTITSPCVRPGIQRCKQFLSVGGTGASYAYSSVPSADELATLCASAQDALRTLPAPAVGRHFAEFCSALSGAAADADNLAELVTFARRRYEASVGTGYLEAPLTGVVASESFARFVVQLAFDAPRFVECYNNQLDEYRNLTKTRSAAQPFPNLGTDGGSLELPLWRIERHRRDSVWVESLPGGGVRMTAGGETVAELPEGHDTAVAALISSDAVIAPKALALTMFIRMFACDLFVHGIGGGRYDQVTDGVIRRYFGVEPPAFVVASMTMYLPLGAHVVSEHEVAAAKERLNRLEHNPDSVLGEVEFESAQEADRALALAAEKRRLVSAIGAPGADKKVLGIKIRETNVELNTILAPVRQAYSAELASLEEQLDASEVLTDRTYPFCFWDPAEIADKVW